MGGGLILFSFFRIIFRTIHFQGCLGVWSRGDQGLRQPCKLRNFAMFYYEKNLKNFLFLYFSYMEIGWIESTPFKIWVKNTQSNLRVMLKNPPYVEANLPVVSQFAVSQQVPGLSIYPYKKSLLGVKKKSFLLSFYILKPGKVEQEEKYYLGQDIGLLILEHACEKLM